MKSKKIILFILAAILALITAFLIWNIFLKPQPQKEIIPVVEQESALSPVNRDELKKLIEDRGGKVAGSVSSKTTYLINNDVLSSSSKNKKAKSLGIPIISEDDFLQL